MWGCLLQMGGTTPSPRAAWGPWFLRTLVPHDHGTSGHCCPEACSHCSSPVHLPSFPALRLEIQFKSRSPSGSQWAKPCLYSVRREGACSWPLFLTLYPPRVALASVGNICKGRTYQSPEEGKWPHSAGEGGEENQWGKGETEDQLAR